MTICSYLVGIGTCRVIIYKHFWILSRKLDFVIFSFDTSHIIDNGSFGFLDIKHLGIVVKNVKLSCIHADF